MKEIISGTAVVLGVPFLMVFYFPAVVAFANWAAKFFGVTP